VTGLAVAASAGVHVPARSLRGDLRAVKIVWQRELMRVARDRPRLVTALLQPLLYLFVLGTGMAGLTGGAAGELRVFLFPGVMVMAVLFTSFFSAGSLVWDREFGFMREMLVAPVRRGAILLGKCLGGATAGVFQGLVVLGAGALAGLPCTPGLALLVAGELAVAAFAVTALGLLVAVRLRAIQAFMTVVQLLVMPLFFLSGALYPLDALPPWLGVLTRLDPLTYAVDPLRRAILEAAGTSATGVAWGGWTLPAAVEVALVAGFGAAALGLAARIFARE
jgi:ABC-2 type transport system permease protein